MENKKINFFRRLKLAIFNLEKYQDLTLEGTKTAVKYLIKLMLIFTAIICIAMTYQYIIFAKIAVDTIKNEVPDFKFEKNILTAMSEEPTIIEKENNDLTYGIIIDTNVIEGSETYNEYTKRINLYNTGLIFLKDKLLISTSINRNIQSITYETIANQYNLQDMNKQNLVEKIDSIDLVSAVIALYLTLTICLFVSYLISTLIETLLLFVLGFLTTKIVGLNLKNGQIYSIAIYALTLPILLNLVYIPVNIMTGFEIKYFQMLYTAISYIYLITAILLIRSDIIKQQAEVGKIVEEQNKVRQEIEEKEEKKEENKEPEDNKNKKEEKNDKKEEKNIGIEGETPEGTV